MQSVEHQHQCTVVQWAKLQEPHYPALALLFAVPNGGLRNKTTAMRLKKEGVKAGIPDLCLPAAHNGYFGLFIEMKAPTATASDVSKVQKDVQAKLNQQNYLSVVCFGADQAINVLTRYLKSPPTQVRGVSE